MKNETIAEAHRIEAIVGNEGLVSFDAKLCKKENIKIAESYDSILSINSALKIIEQKINLLLPKDNNFIKSNGKVTITNIELMYVPQLIDGDKFHYNLIPVWSFESGKNIGTNRYCNIKINALTGVLF